MKAFFILLIWLHPGYTGFQPSSISVQVEDFDNMDSCKKSLAEVKQFYNSSRAPFVVDGNCFEKQTTTQDVAASNVK